MKCNSDSGSIARGRKIWPYSPYKLSRGGKDGSYQGLINGEEGMHRTYTIWHGKIQTAKFRLCTLRTQSNVAVPYQLRVQVYGARAGSIETTIYSSVLNFAVYMWCMPSFPWHWHMWSAVLYNHDMSSSLHSHLLYPTSMCLQSCYIWLKNWQGLCISHNAKVPILPWLGVDPMLTVIHSTIATFALWLIHSPCHFFSHII